MQISIKVSTSWNYFFRWKWPNMSKVRKIGSWWYFCHIYIYIYIYIIYHIIYIYIYIYIYIKKRVSQLFCVLYGAKHKDMHAMFQTKGKKGQNIWKFGQKCTKFENILKKGSLMCATIAHMNQLEYVLNSEPALSQEWVELWS